MTFTPPATPTRGTETIPSPASGAPAYSLLSVTDDLTAYAGQAVSEDGLPRTGVRREHARCVQSVTLDNCTGPYEPFQEQGDYEGTPAASELGSDVGYEFYPFQFSVPVGCDAMHPAYDRLAELASEDVVAATAWNVSRQLWTGWANEGDSTDSPSLRTVATALETTAVPLADAFSLLMDAYYECNHGGAGATFHVPNATLPGLRNLSHVNVVGSQLVGPGGERVSRGPGYPREVGPSENGDSTPSNVADDGEAWIYMSGPIQLRVGTTWDPANPTGAPGRPEGVSNPRRNENSVIRNRRAIFAFDPCCVFAVLAEIPGGD